MKHTDFDFNGETRPMSFTADALFTVYDKFGYTSDILAATKIGEPSTEGWKNCCWMAALMLAQGELQRRHQGYDPKPMITMEQIRTGFMAGDSNYVREKVVEAMSQGFHRDIPGPDDDREVNLVLLEREEEEKKAKAAVAAGLNILRQLLTGSTSRPKKP